MTQPPTRPKIYHITHVKNLERIVKDGGLFSDRVMLQCGGPQVAVGMSRIKQRRLDWLEVRCHPGDYVGDYVPFYFCPRSIMLYLLHCANHPELTYRDGQEPIVHLEADLLEVVAWANAYGRRWAFTTSNAGASYTPFFSDLAELHRVNWSAVQNPDFRAASVKEGKQAEFLLHESFPWQLISRIGVHSIPAQSQALAAIAATSWKPQVTIEPTWYY